MTLDFATTHAHVPYRRTITTVTSPLQFVFRFIKILIRRETYASYFVRVVPATGRDIARKFPSSNVARRIRRRWKLPKFNTKNPQTHSPTPRRRIDERIVHAAALARYDTSGPIKLLILRILSADRRRSQKPASYERIAFAYRNQFFDLLNWKNVNVEFHVFRPLYRRRGPKPGSFFNWRVYSNKLENSTRTYITS